MYSFLVQNLCQNKHTEVHRVDSTHRQSRTMQVGKMLDRLGLFLVIPISKAEMIRGIVGGGIKAGVSSPKTDGIILEHIVVDTQPVNLTNDNHSATINH